MSQSLEEALHQKPHTSSQNSKKAKKNTRKGIIQPSPPKKKSLSTHFRFAIFRTSWGVCNWRRCPSNWFPPLQMPWPSLGAKKSPEAEEKKMQTSRDDLKHRKKTPQPKQSKRSTQGLLVCGLGKRSKITSKDPFVSQQTENKPRADWGPCLSVSSEAHTHHSDSTSGGELCGNVRDLVEWVRRGGQWSMAWESRGFAQWCKFYYNRTWLWFFHWDSFEKMIIGRYHRWFFHGISSKQDFWTLFALFCPWLFNYYTKEGKLYIKLMMLLAKLIWFGVCIFDSWEAFEPPESSSHFLRARLGT